MFRRFSTNYALFLMGIDGVMVILALIAASHMRPLLSFLPFTNDVRKPMGLPFIVYTLFPVVWIIIFSIMSVYDGRRNLRFIDEMTSVTTGSLLAGVSLAGALYLSYRDISRVLFLAFVVTAFLFLTLWRIGTRLIFKRAKGGAFAPRRVLIVGAGPVGVEFREKIDAHSYLGLSVSGFLDDDETKQKTQRDILGTLDQARSVVIKKKINDVVIALPPRAQGRMHQLIAELHDLPVRVLVIPDYYNLALHKAVTAEFAGIPMLDLRAPALNDSQRLVKRGFDLIVTFLVMPLSLIFMAMIALLIRLEGPGPIIFKQKRVGENGRLFEMRKFRTMVVNAEELRHLVEVITQKGDLIHKTESDPRVTRVGKILRKTSLDELPQLYNILVGDMSLVGPRPELPYLVDMYEPWQRKRFAVPQGMTGWWQVNGRSGKPMHLNTEDDLFYVQNYSLMLDFQILLKTIVVVIRGKGAF